MKFLKGLFISVALISLLVACGDNNKKVDNTNNNENQNNVISEDSNVSKATFSMGAWDKNVYSNEFLGIKFNLPTSWSRYTDSEIAGVMELTEEVDLGDEAVLKTIAEKPSVYYVIASDLETGNNLSVISEKPIVDIPLEQYMNQLKSQLDSLESIRYETAEISSEKIDNVEYSVLAVEVPDYGMHQKYYVRKIDKYFLGIIITAYEKEDISEIVAMFE